METATVSRSTNVEVGFQQIGSVGVNIGGFRSTNSSKGLMVGVPLTHEMVSLSGVLLVLRIMPTTRVVVSVRIRRFTRTGDCHVIRGPPGHIVSANSRNHRFAVIWGDILGASITQRTAKRRPIRESVLAPLGVNYSASVTAFWGEGVGGQQP